MTFRSYQDAAEAHKDQTEFNRYEASCILATVEPNSDMDASETARLGEWQRRLDDLAEARRTFDSDALFDKLIT